MTLFRKRFLKPGTYWALNPSTQQQVLFTVTAGDIRHFALVSASMLASGSSILVPLDHRPRASPVMPERSRADDVRPNAALGRQLRQHTASGRLNEVLAALAPARETKED